MQQIPTNCLAIARSSTYSNYLNYFYASHTASDVILVGGAVDNGSGKIRLQVSDSRGAVNDTIWISCNDIGGALQANVSDAATVVDATHVDLDNTSSGIGPVP